MHTRQSTLGASFATIVGTRTGGLNSVASRPPVLLRCGLWGTSLTDADRVLTGAAVAVGSFTVLVRRREGLVDM